MPKAEVHLECHSLVGGDGQCGDAGVVKELEGSIFLALVDGVGHGGEAHKAAALASRHLELNCSGDLVGLLVGLQERLKGTRGAVAACCRLELATGELRCAGVGNVTVRLLGPRATRVVFRDGILGYSIAAPRETKSRLLPGDVLLMHTDGMRENFNLDEFPGLLSETAQAIATVLFRRFGKGTDDTSCLVLRYNA
jgi:negative regulator of sigma-B (phosphoserine phosphatase)